MKSINEISGPLSAIVVTLILTLGLLLGTGAIIPEKHTYATVHYDGGWQKIGVISQEQVYVEVSISRDGSELFSGDLDETSAYLAREAAGNGGIDKTEFRDGITVTADSGVQWIGSESSFKLTIDSLTLESTRRAPLNFANLLDKLKQLETTARQKREETSSEALEYGETPQESFLLSKLIAALSK